MKINPGYDHDDSLACFYLNYVDSKCASFPEMSGGLRAFVDRGMERRPEPILRNAD
jgi:hypothetical protein